MRRLGSSLLVVIALSSCDSDTENDVPVPQLRPVLEAWERSKELHDPNPPGTARDLGTAESKLGRTFPPAFRALYLESNGGSYLHGNLMLERLRGGGSFGSIATLSDDLRATGAGLPSEIVVFGGDGSDSLFGLWLPKARARDAPAPVLELDISGEPFAVVGTELTAFLRAWTAYYLLLLEADRPALDALGVPGRLRRREPDDELFTELREWADPDLPDPRADPYERPATVDELRRRYGADR